MEVPVCRACERSRARGGACPDCGGPITLADENFFIGRKFGKYRIEGILGAGGMGAVFRARHELLGRVAALKIVLPRRLGDEASLRRFLREAQVLAGLRHPGIVEIYDVDATEWGCPYLVMEHLAGATLGAVLRAAGGPLPPAEAAAVLLEAAAALAHAHRRGFIHRDLKPDNLFLALEDGRATLKLLDFGLAKGAEGEGEAITGTGAVLGTPGYIAPEQILGKPLAPAVDQYAFALIAAEVLGGRPVRGGRSVGEILGEALAGPVAPEKLPADFPARWSAAIARATDPEPARRFPDIDEFVAALELPAPDPRALGARTGALPGCAAQTDARARTPSQEAPTTALPGGSPFASTAARTTGAMTGADDRASAAAGEPGRPRSWLGIAGLAVALVSGAALFAWRMRTHRTPPQSAASAPAAFTMLQAPPDAGEPVGVEDGALLLAGSALDWVPLDGKPGSRQPLAAGERVLGAAAPGGWWLLRDGAILRRTADGEETRRSRKPIPWKIGPADAVKISPDGARLARRLNDRVEWLETADPGAPVVIPAGGDPRTPFTFAGDALCLAVAGESLACHALRDGALLWRAEFREARIHALEPEPDAALLAVGGWFDRVEIRELAGGAVRDTIPAQGQTRAFAWLPDGPGLAIAGSAGLRVWRAGGGPARPLGPAGDYRGLLRHGAHLLALDAITREVRVVPLPGAGIAVRERRLNPRPIWALAAAGARLYAGQEDGSLHALADEDGAPVVRTVHTAGITDLAVEGGRLISASDDKTVAVWSRAELAIEWRTPAHAFLVNGLALQSAPPGLWTASSDGVLKRWGWPRLEPAESLDTAGLPGGRESLQCVWVAPDGARLVAGTWAGGLLDYRRDGGRWSARRVAVPSAALYKVAELRGLDALLLAGLKPSALYAHDLRDGRTTRIPIAGFELLAVSGGAAGEAWGAGRGGVLRVLASREPGGALALRAGALLDPAFGELGAVAAAGEDLALGDDRGVLRRVPLAALRGAIRMAPAPPVPLPAARLTAIPAPRPAN